MAKDYTYFYRAVAFLDVLGFKNKLKEFEDEASAYRKGLSEDMGTVDSLMSFPRATYYSKKANDFIDTFERAISKLDSDKFSYYLFSDNICITAQNIISDYESSLVELLLIIAELYYEFVREGYFLRGGIDYGLFIDQASIALGGPLSTAYTIENTIAVFPRIVLSDKFVKQLQQYTGKGTLYFSDILTKSLVKRSCEINYLNIFDHIFKIENKENFFETYNQSLLHNLSISKNKEQVFHKYRWLAAEFNDFIEEYTRTLAFLDENFDPSEDFINFVKQQKVTYG